MHATFTMITAAQPPRLSKLFNLDPKTNQLGKFAGGQLAEGEARKMTATVAEFADLLTRLNPSQALCYGVNGHERARVLSRDRLKNASPVDANGIPAISRTRQHMGFPPDTPGVLMIDHDPSEHGPRFTAGDGADLLAALAEVAPGIADAPTLWRPSASSCIWRTNADGNPVEELKGVGGQRLYLFVRDASDIARAGRALFERLWLTPDFGWMQVGGAGQLLMRSIVDASVWQPERLDFCGGAACGASLVQRLPDPIARNGDADFLDTRTAIPDLAVFERERFKKLIRSRESELRQESQRVREAWVAAKVDQRTAQWIADTERTKEPDDSDAATQIFIAKIKLKTLYEVALGKRGLLHADFDLIVAEDGQWVSATVREVLADPQRFNERETLDPLEPDYDGGRAVGWLNLNADPPELFSQAHGGQRFELVGDPPVEVQGAKDHPAWESAREHIAGLELEPVAGGTALDLLKIARFVPADAKHGERSAEWLVASAVKNEMGGDVAAWGAACPAFDAARVIVDAWATANQRPKALALFKRGKPTTPGARGGKGVGIGSLRRAAQTENENQSYEGGEPDFAGYTGYEDTKLNGKEKASNPVLKEEVTRLQDSKIPYYFMILPDGSQIGGLGRKDECKHGKAPRGPGLWYVHVGNVPTPDGGMTRQYFAPEWISAPFEVLATADDGRGHGYAVALKFTALHGQTHVWTLPRALLVTDGREILQRLYDMGFRATDNPAHANKHIRAYLNRARPEKRAVATVKTGWTQGVFVLPDAVFGQGDDEVFYRSDDPSPSPYSLAGTLDGWRDEVARAVEDFDVPVFALSAAFAPPLLDLLNVQSGGLHFMGTSTTGKTTSQNWALSVWGKPQNLRRSWHGTRAGFEMTAATHCDSVLMLDEIGQADPREIGDLIYMIFNEAGRMRGTARLTARALPRWQLILLSSGEKSLQQMMQDAGKVPMAGQELRLLHIPVDAGDGCGILNGLADSDARSALIREVNVAVSRHHGHPIRAFLDRLTRRETVATAPNAANHLTQFVDAMTRGSISDEVKRGAQRFAMVGYAGELASDWGITGWAPGRARSAAETLFRRWLATWGTAARHDETVFLEHLEVWLSGNRPGRFAEVDPVTLATLQAAERAMTSMRPFFGYVAATPEGWRYFLNAAGWQDLTKGVSRDLAIDTLLATGRLEKDPRGTKGKLVRVGDRSSPGRYYIVREGGDHA